MTLALALLQAVGCATLPDIQPGPPSHALAPDPESPLAQRYAGDYNGQSGFALVGDGADAFALRISMIEQAKHTLDLQYYIIRPDDTGHFLLAKLVEAARRGVRVRLLVDDIYTAGRDMDMAELASQANIDVRVFNPFMGRDATGLSRLVEFVFDPDRVNRRMHNKLFIADNSVVIFGGRNLGNEYFSSPSDISFVDLDVFAAGPVVQEISNSFDEYWNDKLAVPITQLTRLPSEKRQHKALDKLARQARAYSQSKGFHDLYPSRRYPEGLPRRGDLSIARYRAVWDNPRKATPPTDEEHDDRIGIVVQRIIDRAQREVQLTSPYFVPGEDGIEQFARLRERQVSVAVLTNSLAANDVPAVHAGYAKYRPALLEQGVTLYELRPLRKPPRSRILHLPTGSTASLHAKALVVDRQTVVIGSANADPRSRFLNTEFAVVIYSGDLAAQMVRSFSRLTQPDISYRVMRNGNDGLKWVGKTSKGQVETLSEPEASAWRRMMSGVYSVIAPEKML
ncbi:phospholipase D family protein [Uliginosibacterium sp. sgz301328]|uniref:phospholipase D family protein n=1 Tax=Uliginosibacterium sp. sgz301328 TaxID=3243764 RepID=UPI00359ED3E4